MSSINSGLEAGELRPVLHHNSRFLVVMTHALYSLPALHHNRFGFYSSNVGHITIENNHIHNNYMYGLDPHTGTHDMIIRNNTVHDHGTMGIICSQDCFNILIEANGVYNSFGSGIMFSRNMYDSVARNNNVHDEDKCSCRVCDYEWQETWTLPNWLCLKSSLPNNHWTSERWNTDFI